MSRSTPSPTTTDERQFYLDATGMGIALHRSQRCPHGAGPDPKPLPKGYLDGDIAIAQELLDEYRAVYEEAEDSYIEGLLDEMVDDGLLEKVVAR